jgi:L-fucose isomerase-like protein
MDFQEIIAGTVGKENTFGTCVGRVKESPMTYARFSTNDQLGIIQGYVGEGQFTNDPVPDDFFGCAGVVQIPGLQDVLMHAVRNGHKHHVSVTPGSVLEPFHEALTRYLHMDVTIPQCK